MVNRLNIKFCGRMCVILPIPLSSSECVSSVTSDVNSILISFSSIFLCSLISLIDGEAIHRQKGQTNEALAVHDVE